MKKVVVLGSTGSIGRSTLDIIRSNSEDFKVVGLTAGRNIDLLEEQVRSFEPEIVAVADRRSRDALSRRVGRREVLFGPEGIGLVASLNDADVVVSAIVGAAGLLPTIEAVRAGKTVGLANKETLVMAGEIVTGEAARHKAKIIPVDSEHSAVFQCLAGRRRSDLKRIILTASGGPFLNRSGKDLEHITPKEALKHPNWSMGRKISIDSATLMNKGLEMIEACWFFGFGPGAVDVLIHPQSIIHSMVEFRDRSVLAQMSMPDMRGPISYALSYPRRLKDPIAALELDKVKSLTFRKPDMAAFPCLSYAYEAMQAAGTMPCVMNASNEVAVGAFLDERIGFNDIPSVVRDAMDRHNATSADSLDQVLEADRWARRTAARAVRRLHK